MKPRVTFLSTPSIEKWSHANPDTRGIGGSETSHIELSWRLARRGFDVTSYVPGQEDGDEVWRDVLWQNYTKADYSAPGVWFIYRDPTVLDKFPVNHPDQTLIFIAQDVRYKLATEERLLKLDKYVCLCEDHAGYVAAEWPAIADRIVISGNGLKPELVDATLAMNITRNPKRLMYASSPDRGLKNLVIIFKRAKEYVPDLELHVYYGFDNIDKIISDLSKDQDQAKAKANIFYIRKEREQIQKVLNGVPDIHMHGRLPQAELYQEWCKAGIWCHPSSFSETACITSMESMALGAIPITNPIWALRENVRHGVLIQGNPDSDLLVRSRFAGEVIRLTSGAGIKAQELIRADMMPWAKAKFSWENYADQLSGWVLAAEAVAA